MNFKKIFINVKNNPDYFNFILNNILSKKEFNNFINNKNKLIILYIIITIII